MKATPSALKTHMAGGVTTLATLWRITLTDGTIRRFTDHDAGITYGGATYTSAAGYEASDVETSSAMSVSNMELRGFILSPHVTEDEILSGLWDHALVEIFRVNYADLTMGDEKLFKGRLGEITKGRQVYRAELRSMTQQLQRNIGELTSISCRYDLGDTRCAQNLTDYTVSSATISAVASNHQFTTNLPTKTVRLTPSTTGAPPDDYFQGGKLTWLTGANAGKVVEVEEYDSASGDITLTQSMYFDVTTSDTFSVVAGCNKLHKTADGVYDGHCKVRFGNVVNFGGEPELVGEKVLQVGRQ